MDNWAAADTVIAWGAKDKEIRKACEEAGFGVRLTDLQYLRNIAAVPVRNRIVSP
jgi:hypothetical protein